MQLPEGAQWKRVQGTAAGTTVLKDSRTVLYGVVIGQNKTGTVTFYDHASGTSATSYMTAVDNTSGTQPTSLYFGMRMRNGITVTTGGTTDMLVAFQ